MMLSKYDTPKRISPFLKWPGGKRWLAPLLSELISAETSGRYFEPFLGAGAVFLQLQPKRAILSDTNEELVHFLGTIGNSAEAVVRLVQTWENTAECYAKVRSSNPRSNVRRAARFLFLNRTCWGGIYRTNRRGEFNVPFGNSGRPICSLEEVVKAAAIYKRARLVVDDFEAVITDARGGDAVYADPPYTVKGENNGFIRYNEKLFSWHDQERLSLACRSAKRRGAFVCVSGLNHVDLLSLYPGWWAMKMPRYSTVGRDPVSRKKVSEVVIFSRKPRAASKETLNSLKRIKTKT